MPEWMIEAHQAGVSPTQIALDRFFATQSNEEKLQEIYQKMTGRAESTGLGYYKIERELDDKLLGGAALAPTSEGEPAEEVDIALHILDSNQNHGLGSKVLRDLLEKAFRVHGVQRVVGSSIVEHKNPQPSVPSMA